MISRATLFSSPGGDTIQLTETASYLRKLNLDVDIKLTNESIDYTRYDLIHFFNVIRPADILAHIKKSALPYVISTIFVDYAELEKKKRRGFVGILTKSLGPDFVEYLKAISRFLINGEKINSYEYLFRGHSASIRKVIKGAKLLLPNSNSEYKRLSARYGIHQRYKVIPNAINISIFKQTTDSDFKGRDRIVCVARIEERKNQLNLIHALKDSPYKLLIVGKPSPNNLQYFNQCKAEASENVTFVDHINQLDLVKIYNSCKVHVLPSWFETTGLSSLEAAACGCNIVVTRKGDTEEYFKDFAYYCTPDDPCSIRAAIDNAYKEPFNQVFQQYILNHYTWQETAELTLKGYNEILTSP
jgi:glycosyltransferase involved in cell wall biosynthesis